MASRLDLQAIFEEILESRNVYFSPPANIKMNYDAIRYEMAAPDIIRADDKAYRHVNQYSGIVIARDPESTIPNKILYHFPMCSLGRPYVKDNLYHYPFTLYY